MLGGSRRMMLARSSKPSIPGESVGPLAFAGAAPPRDGAAAAQKCLHGVDLTDEDDGRRVFLGALEDFRARASAPTPDAVSSMNPSRRRC